jgi:hypothetical protein
MVLLSILLPSAPLAAQDEGTPAPRPENPQPENPQPEEKLRAGIDSGELEVAVLLAPFAPTASAVGGSTTKKGGSPSQVAAWLQVPGRDLLKGHTSAELGVDARVRAFDGEGELRASFDRRLVLDLEKVGERLRGSSLRLYGNLELEPGHYDLRLWVGVSGSDHHALRRFPFEVPGREPGRAGLLPPFFVDDEGDALVVRRGPGEEAGEAAPYPFIVGEDEEFVPDIAPVVSPDLPRARIVLMGYHLQRDDVLVNAVLLSGDGQRLGKDRLLMVGRAETAANGLDRLHFSLETEGLRAGDHRLEITLHDLAGGQVKKTFLPFRVAGSRKE